MEVAVADPYVTNPGPIDSSVLYDQEKHVSSAVWDGQERGALRCHEHTSKLDQWALTEKQMELVEKAGFHYLRLIPAISLDNPLISALVERWRRETNTFHLNVGEMTVTLKDVALLLGLAIDGEPVIGITYTTCSSVCEKYLGRAPESGYTSGGMVKLSWLKEFFFRCPEDAPIEVIEQHTRAYLLYLVGSTIFSTTTGNKVPVMYLPLFDDFEQCGKYAWGAAALGFLYRALGNASLRSQSTISGCLTLLQCWSYFHLNVGRPKLNHDPMHDRFPFVLKWKGKQSGPTANRDVVFYRKALDSLKPSDVEWLPYRNMDSMVIPEDIKSTLILGRSKTMLICFDKAERHLPNRCLRQYGMLQSIPEDVQRWERKSRGVDGGVDLSGKMESELNEWLDRRLHIVEGDDGADENEYMLWFLRITRKFVGRPISLSSEFQRTNAGLSAGLYLVALGVGGIKGSLPPHGAEQFDETTTQGRKQRSSYFNYYVFCLSCGALIAVTFVVWIEDNKGWQWGFGISTATILMSIPVFLLGSPTYRTKIPSGSPITTMFKVLAASIYNTCTSRNSSNAVMITTSSPTYITETGDKEDSHGKEKMPSQEPTESLNFLNKAAIKQNAPQMLECTVKQVEEVKVVLRIIPIFMSTIMLNCCLAQLSTFSVQQAATMNTKLGSLKIPPASLPVFPVLFIMILAPVYNHVIIPLARKITKTEMGITHLQRIGTGLFLSIIAMAVAALVETKRKKVAAKLGLLNSAEPLPITFFWVALQYLFLGSADLFTLAGMMEFFFTEASSRMRSLATSLSWASLAMGYYLSSVLVSIINHVTSAYGHTPWLFGSNLNHYHLERFYWLMCILSGLNFLHYLFWANRYKYRSRGPDN